jgi:hypothetical protein
VTGNLNGISWQHNPVKELVQEEVIRLISINTSYDHLEGGIDQETYSINNVLIIPTLN